MTAGEHRAEEVHDDLSVALAAAVENLYLVFGRYGLRSHIEGCSCCVCEGDQASLRSRSLRALTADDLDRFLSKALTTWGDSEDFRHFLPRLLELATGAAAGDIEPERVLGKLLDAEWWEWPQQERDAVESVLWLRWNLGLLLPPREFDAGEWLCGVRHAGIELSRYIDAWRSNTAPASFDHLAMFLTNNPHVLTEGQLGHLPNDSFWEQDVALAMRDWLDDAMSNAEFQTRLADWYQTRLAEVCSPYPPL
jgi:hypothetical protein